ncbi:MAG: HAD-IIB family hydrolase [Spirochaetaceae bacterium]|nr:MAG: HAD-IIB family hydrolase [Spirochaetaceae bacterium]
MSTTQVLQPIAHIPASVCTSLQILFSDIDDTITAGGLVTAASFAALWRLHQTGVAVVPVTGRPAGWCDHIARMWPVNAVIGENGAFYYSYDREERKMRRVSLIAAQERLEGREKLERIRRRVLQEVPGSRIAADQQFRITDLAIDFCEDVVPPLSAEKIKRICGIVEEEGATYKISSIHINCWYGSFDKVTGVRRFLADRGRDLASDEVQGSTAFIGDSPNDEPMFAALRHSIAVANIRGFLDRLNHSPAYVTEKEFAAGFSEAVDTILKKRGD